MGISLPKAEQKVTLDRAVRDARDPKVVADPRWTARIEWLSEQIAGGDAKGRTYVAATGAAMLAKSVNDQADTLAQNAKGGPRGFSLRGTAELMQSELLGKVHLGTRSKWPMNNAPFLRGPARIEHFVIAGYLKHVYDEYVDWMRELDGCSSSQAYDALVAFVRVRMEVQRTEAAAAAASPRVKAAASTEALLAVLQLWMTEDPEDGARGQAVRSGVLSLVWDDVEVVGKHNPATFDVRRGGKPAPLVCEAKQQAIGDQDVLELARRAAEADSNLAIYAALAKDQQPLPADRLRRDSLERHGTVLDVVHDVYELVARASIYGGVSPATVAATLGGLVVARCAQADVSSGGALRLRNLLDGAGVDAPSGPDPAVAKLSETGSESPDLDLFTI